MSIESVLRIVKSFFTLRFFQELFTDRFFGEPRKGSLMASRQNPLWEPLFSRVNLHLHRNAKHICEWYFFHKENVCYLSFSRRGQLVAHVDKESTRQTNQDESTRYYRSLKDRSVSVETPAAHRTLWLSSPQNCVIYHPVYCFFHIPVSSVLCISSVGGQNGQLSRDSACRLLSSRC